jgi:hypothetical protein
VTAVRRRVTARTGRWLLVGVAIAVLVVGGIIVATVPRGEPDVTVAFEDDRDAAVAVRIVIEEIDGTRGTMKARVAAVPGGADLPDDGVTLLTEIDGLEPLRVQANSIALAEGEGEIRFDSGSVGGYPYDRYGGSFSLVAVKGSPATFDEIVDTTFVPVSLTMIDGSSGYQLDAAIDDPVEGTDRNFATISYDISRSAPVVVWASTMMAIYWLLTATVVAVVLAVLLGYREWETRHLAWLAAMIFAFTSFRAAAPGAPPIGVYFDFASFFWAELLVALALAAMTVNFLVGHNIAGLEGPALDDLDPAPVGPDGEPDPHR